MAQDLQYTSLMNQRPSSKNRRILLLSRALKQCIPKSPPVLRAIVTPEHIVPLGYPTNSQYAAVLFLFDNGVLKQLKLREILFYFIYFLFHFQHCYFLCIDKGSNWYLVCLLTFLLASSTERSTAVNPSTYIFWDVCFSLPSIPPSLHSFLSSSSFFLSLKDMANDTEFWADSLSLSTLKPPLFSSLIPWSLWEQPSFFQLLPWM